MPALHLLVRTRVRSAQKQKSMDRWFPMLFVNFPERFVYAADIDILREPANARTPPPNCHPQADRPPNRFLRSKTTPSSPAANSGKDVGSGTVVGVPGTRSAPSVVPKEN